MIGRLFIAYAIKPAQQLTYEIVPTQLRGQANALANMVAQMTSFFAPQIVLSEVIHHRMPYVLMGLAALLAGTMAYFLPETAGIKLPDTIEESEVLFKRKSTMSTVAPAPRPTEEVQLDVTKL